MATTVRSRTPLLLIGGALLVLVLFLALPSELVELLWLDSLGYTAIYWKILLVQVGLFVSVFALVMAYFGLNFYVLLRRLPPVDLTGWTTASGAPAFGDLRLTRGRLSRIATGLTLVLGFLFAIGFSARWEDIIRFLSEQRYGEVDPLFGRDLAFYMLQLPFLETLQGLAVGLTLLGLFLMVAIYLLIGDFVVQEGRVQARPKVVKHISVNAALLLAAWGWGFYLDRFELLSTPGGVVHGAGYADVHIVIPALWVMIGVTVVLIALVIANIWLKRTGLLIGGGVLYLLIMFVGLTLIPGLVQQFSVEPNELELERPYIQHNIDMTRKAYGIDQVQAQPYPAELNLTMEDVQANAATLRNVRLWDPRLLIETYRQIQEIRLYYQFYNVDIDRYEIDGEVQQVMLSARELVQRLPDRSDTWFNRHLQYTHGYGLAMSPVANRGQEGVPQLYIRDLPPVVDVEGLQVQRPAIYYGERTPTYRIVNSQAEEMAYPQGDDNVYTHYDGTGGVLLSSYWRRLLFAWTQSDFNIVLSDYIAPQTRIQFWNRVQERVRRIAPFLQLDRDPYLVLTEGRLVWVQDAYTISQYFPYAEPTDRRFSYIRNSVKVIVDAYHGAVDFYVVDPDDPVLGAYREAFPNLFKPLNTMSEDLQRHLRYPQDLFEVQVSKYNRYHMASPQVFYNNEDLWTRPNEQYGGNTIPMEPYYILTRLPGEEEEQFLLMTPLTPENRNNMIAWMAARNDMPGYGELVVYELPKEKLIYGPSQVEARIDQDTEISRQLSLWDQRGSRVIRGNLIVVPVGESFIYVEPVFLIAQEVQIPQLRRVIVAYGERVVMEPTLDQALNALFGTEFEQLTRALAVEGGPPPPVVAQDTPPAEVQRARAALQRAEEALRRGDFATFGSEFETLKQALSEESTTESLPQMPDTTVEQ